MGWQHRYTQQAPAEKQIRVELVPVTGVTCPRCGGADIRRYPIANHLGPRMATKCQDCLYPLAFNRPTESDNWPPFRAVTYDWEASPAERAARELAVRDPGFATRASE
ncbi:hypothetical protein [Rhodococcus opacus]|uniref:hypothetical protein n=1 Tax=Rhodococcus opacus TaxID=37919 RepID=UPI001C20AEF8|nr:hypothetical protein [Rhodococcus opacus]